MPKGSSGAPLEFSLDQRALVQVQKALRTESDGKALRRDLVKELRATVAPIIPEVRSAVRSIPATTIANPSLREAVASQVKAQVRLGGKTPGVAVRVGTARDPRGFRFAARRLNRGQWRHKVFGQDVWVEQRSGRTGWFDAVMLRHRDDAREAVGKAVHAMAVRIAERSNSRGA